MNGGHGQRNGTILCLLTNPTSTCNKTMVGFEFGDSVNPEGSELANMVDNDAKLAANVALPPRYHKVLIESSLNVRGGIACE
ncbi:hypothetical protein TNCV_1006871 [Trichonephila clavipes]|nr:hypothetical protein TNCV_1006871 [Trichonephila clavipes]